MACQDSYGRSDAGVKNYWVAPFRLFSSFERSDATVQGPDGYVAQGMGRPIDPKQNNKTRGKKNNRLVGYPDKV